MSIKNFIEQFPNEKSCEDYITKETFKDGEKCLVCGSIKKIYKIKSNCRKQKYKCSDCKKTFTILRGTIFEKSNLDLQDWFLAMYLLNTSSKGISSIQLAEKLDCTQKTAWFVLQRLRNNLNLKKPMLNGIVEIDETYIGGKNNNRHSNKRLKGSQGGSGKAIVIGAIERGSNKVKAEHVPNTKLPTIQKFVLNNILPCTTYTDEAQHYKQIQKWHSK